MFYFLTITLMLHLSLIIDGINVQFDGSIDLGSKYGNYKYQIQPFAADFDALSKLGSYADPERVRGSRKKRKKIEEQPITPATKYKARENHEMRIPKDVKNETTDIKGHGKNKKHSKNTTRYIVDYTLKELYGRERKVKHDDLVRGFMENVYKRNIKVIDSVKAEISDRHLRNKINTLSENYGEKFIEFSNVTQKLKMKTKLAAQKVILDTIDTSNRILTRLANHLLGEVNRKGALRNGITAVNVLQKEVTKETESELQYACKKFGFCHSTDNFSRFLIDVISNLLHNTNQKLKQAFDALTEVLKTSEYGGFLNPATEKRYHKLIDYVERLPPDLLRSGLLIVKNTIAHKNKPIVVNGRMDERVNKTVALLYLIDNLDAKLPSNEANKLEWNDIKNSLHQWSEGRRWDIEDIMQTLVVQVRKGIHAMENSSAESTYSNMHILLN